MLIKRFSVESETLNARTQRYNICCSFILLYQGLLSEIISTNESPYFLLFRIAFKKKIEKKLNFSVSLNVIVAEVRMLKTTNIYQVSVE
jgi:hypothetical protein